MRIKPTNVGKLSGHLACVIIGLKQTDSLAPTDGRTLSNDIKSIGWSIASTINT